MHVPTIAQRCKLWPRNSEGSGWAVLNMQTHSCLLICGTLALALRAGPPAPQEPDTSTAAVVRAATAYVAEYQQRLTSVLADESCEQQVVRRLPPDNDAVRIRRMTSEVFFMFMPQAKGWMAVRDVVAVDGKPADDRSDIREALDRLADHDVAATLKAQNSRFNIGRVTRNFSEPTLGLLVLDGRHRERFKFERRRVQRETGTVLVTLAFTEKDSPTLIWDNREGPVFSSGEIVVEAQSGRVRQTVFRARSRDINVELTTSYAPHDQLEMWVPASFRESYESGVNRKGPERGAEYEHVVAVATYRNYRRFETAVRIK